VSFMKYIYMFMMFCIVIMTSLNAQKKELSDVLQRSGEKKIIVKPLLKKKEPKHVKCFVFKDTCDANDIGSANKKQFENSGKSQSYKYQNKSKFKFKFTSGTGDSNLVGGRNTGLVDSVGIGSGTSGQGSGQH